MHDRKSTIDYESEPYRSNFLDHEYGNPMKGSQPPQTVRPPLYVNGSDLRELDNDRYGKSTSPSRHTRQRSYHSIDNVNCMIVTDGPNVYEKKR